MCLAKQVGGFLRKEHAKIRLQNDPVMDRENGIYRKETETSGIYIVIRRRKRFGGKQRCTHKFKAKLRDMAM